LSVSIIGQSSKVPLWHVLVVTHAVVIGELVRGFDPAAHRTGDSSH
jgi:hypothetical protein